MNWFDLIVAILLLIALLKGYRKGLIMQLVALATIILSAIFGGQLAKIILPEFDKMVKLSPEVSRVVSFIIAFAAIALLLSLIGRLIQRFIDEVSLAFFNKLLGGIIAAATMMLFLSILINLFSMLDKNEQLITQKVKKESFFYERIEAVVPAVVPYLDKELWEEYVPEEYRKEVEEKSERIFTPPSDNGAAIDSSYQQRHFDTH